MPDNTKYTGYANEFIEYIAARMADGVYKHALKRELEALVGDKITVNAYEKMRQMARALLANRAQQPRHELLQDAIQFWRRRASNDDLPPSLQMKAQENLQELLGLGAKWRETTDPAETANETKRALTEVAALDDEAGNEPDEAETLDSDGVADSD